MPTGLLKRMYISSSFARGSTTIPFTLTTSLGPTRSPKTAVLLLIATFPISIYLSASLREHKPLSLIYLFKRIFSFSVMVQRYYIFINNRLFVSYQYTKQTIYFFMIYKINIIFSYVTKLSNSILRIKNYKHNI